MGFWIVPPETDRIALGKPVLIHDTITPVQFPLTATSQPIGKFFKLIVPQNAVTECCVPFLPVLIESRSGCAYERDDKQ